MGILSEHDITSLKSMAMYWEEVSKRESSNVDQILYNELKMVIRHLGTRILWIIVDYIRLLEKEVKE